MATPTRLLAGLDVVPDVLQLSFLLRLPSGSRSGVFTHRVDGDAQHRYVHLQHDIITSAVFQLGIFLRVLHPAHTVLRPARLYSALPELKKKKKHFLFTKCNCCFCVFRQGCKNACKMLADSCPCFHRSPTKLCPGLVSFMCWIATKFWSFAL